METHFFVKRKTHFYGHVQFNSKLWQSLPEAKPLSSDGFPMVFLWFSHGFPMGFPMVFRWYPIVFYDLICHLRTMLLSHWLDDEWNSQLKSSPRQCWSQLTWQPQVIMFVLVAGFIVIWWYNVITCNIWIYRYVLYI